MLVPRYRFSVRRLAAKHIVFTILMLLPLEMRSQTAADPAAPTDSDDPAAIDLTGQKVSSKYGSVRNTILQQVEKVNSEGPFRADYESLQKYQVPDWYKEATFGIFIHWGVYAVPAFGSEWYPRQMYTQGSEEYKPPHCHLRHAGQIRLLRISSPCSKRRSLILRHGPASSRNQAPNMSYLCLSTTMALPCTTTGSRIGPRSRWAASTWWEISPRPYALRDCISGPLRTASSITSSSESDVRSVRISTIHNMRHFMGLPTTGW